MTSLDEYFELYNEYFKIYKERTCLLIQFGTFYEMYQKTEIGNLNNICDLLEIKQTRKKNSIELSDKNPYMAGIPVVTLDKHLNKLVSNNYVVIIYDQLLVNGKITRIKKGIYSRSLNTISFNENNQGQDILTSLFIHDSIVSILHLDNSVNSMTIIEKHNQDNNAIISMILNFKSSEYNVYTIDIDLVFLLNKLISEHDIIINIINDIPKELYKVDCQNDYLKEYYSHLTFGMLSPIEFLNLEFYPTSVINLLCIIDFIKCHDCIFIENLNPPIVNTEKDYLDIALDSMNQLNVLPDKKNKHKYNSLYHIIDFTNTSMGRRKLKNLLSRPFKNQNVIQNYYKMSNSLLESAGITDILLKIKDFEKLHRKMGIGKLQPFELIQLHDSYTHILLLLEKASNFPELKEIMCDIKVLTDYMSEYQTTFDMEKITNESLNIFKNNTVLDNLNKEIMNCELDLQNMETDLNKLTNEKSFIKLLSDKNGYYFTLTLARFECIKKKLPNNIMTIQRKKSDTRLKSQELIDISEKLMEYNKDFNIKSQELFIKSTLKLSKKYNKLFVDMAHFVGTIDILMCNVQLYKKHKYTCPILVENDSSFINTKNIRHPIIEKILKDVPYIENDICLDDSNNMVLVGCNSSGKSSMLRSLGLNLILAQCGLFVSASHFEYSIFTKLICQVDLTDNFFKNASSFITELKGLSFILENCDKNSLVLTDELVKGTEAISASTLFASTIDSLSQMKTKFLFTTHLHDICDLNIIKKNNGIKFYHMDSIITDNQIVFLRKLKLGTIDSMYGLEVAKTLLKKKFIDKAFKIRQEILEGAKKKTKSSNYNVEKKLIKCEICNSTNLLETHHIINQCESDTTGFFKKKSFHKNAKHNLACLCKNCHLQVTHGTIIVNGYIQTSNGVILDFHKV
jgi:DNA mismatch repair protein MutS